MLTQEVAKFDFSFNDRLFPSGTTGRTEVGSERGGGGHRFGSFLLLDVCESARGF